ncbi:MAG: hypothetical protein ACUVTM_02710 [Candidatus Bathyarchaeia archaeon]
MKVIRLEVPDMVPVDGTNLNLTQAQRILGEQLMSILTFHSQSDKAGLDMNHVARRNQRLVNEVCIRLDFDVLMVNDWNMYPEGYRPAFIDSQTYIDHLGRIFRVKPNVKTTYWID